MSDKKSSGPRPPKGGSSGRGGKGRGPSTGGPGGTGNAGRPAGGPKRPGGRGTPRDAGAPTRATSGRPGGPQRPTSDRPGGPVRSGGPKRPSPNRPGPNRSGPNRSSPNRQDDARSADRRPAGRSHPASAATADGPDWLYGGHAVRAALHNPARRALRLIATKNASEAVAEAAQRRGLQIELAEGQEMDRMFSTGTVHQGIALKVAPLPEPVLADVLKAANEDTENSDKPLIILDQVTDPQNVGAVLRSAAVFGARAVIVTRRNSPPITGALAKAASGAVEQMPLVQVPNVAQAIAVLQAEGWFAVGLEGTAEKSLGEIDLKGRVVLVMGAEGTGLRRLTAERCDLLAKIPGDAGFASLNVSNAAAVALYEIRRQGS